MAQMQGFSGLTRATVRCACFLFLGAGLVLSGCASGSLTIARDAFYQGDISRASEALPDPGKVGSREQLLYYMEKGAILHYAGDYQESANLLLKAAALIRDQEIISASQQVTSLVINEWMTDYKGEYAERLLVHTFQMMNYLLLGRNDDALVEAKQALDVCNTYPKACDGDYFTRSLIAHCFEAVGDINGAYIEYKKLAGLMGDPRPVARRLCDLGSRLGFDDEVEHFRQFLPPSEAGAPEHPVGEVIIFLSRGRAPVKIPQDIFIPPTIRFSFSTYEDRGGRFSGPDAYPLPLFRQEDRITTDVGDVLRASLKERLAQIIAKETARVVAKEAIANNIRNSDAEVLARIVFLLMETPDTRCWETLPGSLTLIRVPLYPGDDPSRWGALGRAVPLPPADPSSDHPPYYRYYSIK